MYSDRVPPPGRKRITVDEFRGLPPTQLVTYYAWRSHNSEWLENPDGWQEYPSAFKSSLYNGLVFEVDGPTENEHGEICP